MKTLPSMRLDFHSLYTFYHRVQGYLCRGLLLVLYLWHSMKFLHFFYCQLSAENLPLLLMLPFWKWVPISRQANFSTHDSLLLKQTRTTDLPLELTPSYQTSLIWGSKSFVVQHIFALEIIGADEGALLRECVAPPSCVPAFRYECSAILKAPRIPTSSNFPVAMKWRNEG